MKPLLLFICLLAGNALLAQSAPAILPEFAGRYTGDVYNGDDLDPITTTLRLAAGNRLTGEYLVQAEQFDYEGVISNIVFEDDYSMTGEWTDRFGEGLFHLEFSRDFSGFTGYWTSFDSDAQLPWNGKRQ
jgi:hypothetical protein